MRGERERVRGERERVRREREGEGWEHAMAECMLSRLSPYLLFQ